MLRLRLRSISSALLVVMINASVIYVGLVAISVWFEYRQFHENYFRVKNQALENDARKIDADYFHGCLSETHQQLIYPDLLRQHEFLNIAKSVQFVPLGTQPHADIASCNEGYGFITYRSDRYGFRNSDSQWDRRIDAVLIGASYVQGGCVGDGAYWPHLLSESFGLNAVSLATGSNTPKIYRALTEAFVPMASPRFAILFLTPNDNVVDALDDIFLTVSPDNLRSSYRPSGIQGNGLEYFRRAAKLLDKPQSVDRGKSLCDPGRLKHQKLHSEIVANHARFSKLINLESIEAYLTEPWSRLKPLLRLDLIRNTVKIAVHSSLGVIPPSTATAVDALMARCKQSCKPVVVLLPTSNYWRPDYRADGYFDLVTRYISANYSQNPPLLFDGRTIIDRNGLEDFSPVGPHYSEEAYKKLVAGLVGALRSTQAEEP
jgi:hypothetical protein